MLVVQREHNMSDIQLSTTIGSFQVQSETPSAELDFSWLPAVYVLDTHLSLDELHNMENQLIIRGAPLTYNKTEAKLFLGRISQVRRAKLELSWANIHVEDEEITKRALPIDEADAFLEHATTTKRQRLSNHGDDTLEKGTSASPDNASTRTSSTVSETEDEAEVATQPMSQLSLNHEHVEAKELGSDQTERKESPFPAFDVESFVDTVKVVKLAWLEDSLNTQKVQPPDSYIIYQSKVVARNHSSAHVRPQFPVTDEVHPSTPASHSGMVTARARQAIIERAKADPKPKAPYNPISGRDRTKAIMEKEFAGRTFASSSLSAAHQRSQHIPLLLHQTTSENEEGVTHVLPDMPDWVKKNKIYACERPAPLYTPNDGFIEQLRKIRLARILTADEIGVRAYSTSIAAIAAYPHTLSMPQEVLALPGCDQKTAHLFDEWHTSSGHIQAVDDIEADPVLSVLRTFYEIWGVGATTAREFYYDSNRMYRDLDDIVEKGWRTLSRVQQIGVKYYDEFQLKIPRSEVEAIAEIVAAHARAIIDDSIECVIVGGHRRGKHESGDVDLILSHRSEAATYNLVTKVVHALEQTGWITHTLTLNLTNTKRNQQPLPIKSDTKTAGFDTLDKALVVWQDPNWPTKATDLAQNPKFKNPNVHRRVDIIISPWRTVGCAVAGWTSGTTFQRDLRRYARKVKGWKFDSSGVRDRATGKWVDLERWGDLRTRAKTWEEAEKSVFDGMGLEFFEPELRNSG